MNSVKVYVADTKTLEDAELFKTLYSCVSDRRQEKINRIAFEADKRLSLGAELLLKKALSDIGISDYEFSYGENGKPFIKGAENLFFNLSHSGERVMCAISSKAVGCDVEKVKPVDLKIAKRFFFAEEYETIEAKQTPEEQKAVFFRLWTLKESFMKVTGLGMKLPLDSFCISLDGTSPSVSQSVSTENYYFKEYFFEEDYKYSVCSLVPDFEESVSVDFSALIQN